MANIRGHIGKNGEVDTIRLYCAFLKGANAFVIARCECQMQFFAHAAYLTRLSVDCQTRYSLIQYQSCQREHLMHKRILSLVLSAFFIGLASPGWAQMKTRINWTAVTGAQSGMFTAQQEGLFKKNGLDVELIHIPSSSRGIQAILAGEIAFSFMDGNNEVQADLKGANIALVAGATNRQVFSLMARPEIKRIADLRGKKIGITRIGSSTHTSALYALGSAGLKPADVQLLPLLEVPNIFTALAAGQIEAGVISPPINARAKNDRFVVLLNIA